MRLKLAQMSTHTPRLAVVFGPAELAERIREGFERLGRGTFVMPTPRDEGELVSALRAMGESGAEVFVHPGISFWSERPSFPSLVASLGMVPVSPSAKFLSLYQNKISFLTQAQSLDIPTLAATLDPVSTVKEASEVISEHSLRFPLLLKSVLGGAGFGTLHLRSEADLHAQLPLWFDQLDERYGDSTAIIERTLTSARHWIVPFARDREGEITIFPIVDGSLQNRWKRFIQFCPAQDLDGTSHRRVEEYVRRWANHVRFEGIGTLEFLSEADRLYLIDGSARLNAAFPLWEKVAGVSALEWQLASMGLLSTPKRSEPFPFEAGISIRLHAEDPVRLLPAPGRIHEMSPERVWKDAETEAFLLTPYQSGMDVMPDSSGVIGEFFCFARGRKRALELATKRLEGFWMSGSLLSNQKFALEHLHHPFVRENLFHAGFTDEEFIPESWPSSSFLRQVVDLAARLFGDPGARWVVSGQWVEEGGIPLELSEHSKFRVGDFEGASGLVRFADLPPTRFSFYPLTARRWNVRVGVWTVSVRRVGLGEAGNGTTLERSITALASGQVHAIFEKAGAQIAPQSRLVMIRSLGQLVPHAVLSPVKVLSWNVKPGDQVTLGQELAKVELIKTGHSGNGAIRQ